MSLKQKHRKSDFNQIGKESVFIERLNCNTEEQVKLLFVFNFYFCIHGSFRPVLFSSFCTYNSSPRLEFAKTLLYFGELKWEILVCCLKFARWQREQKGHPPSLKKRANISLYTIFYMVFLNTEVNRNFRKDATNPKNRMFYKSAPKCANNVIPYLHIFVHFL